MTEPASHSPHHNHVRKALDVVREKHAAVIEHHQQVAAAEVERRAAYLAEQRISASAEAQQ